MGLLDGLLGNATEVDPKNVDKHITPLLIPGESLLKAFKIVRDIYAFTDKRLILVDVQGITGSKVEYQSIPYSKITRFSVETAGGFDADAELKLWISGSQPLHKEFKRGTNLLAIQQLLASKILE